VCCGRLQSLRSRVGVVGVATRLGWRLAWETRYTFYDCNVRDGEKASVSKMK
jgi:hypothetical protein